MDVFNDKPPEVTVDINSVPIKLEKRNADLPKVNTRLTLKNKSGDTQTSSISSSSPSLIWTHASVFEHSQSEETKRPSAILANSSAPSSPTTRCLAPSLPLSDPTVPSPPISKSSALPSSEPPWSTTPVSDAIIEIQNSSRRTFGGQASDGLWPSIRNLSSSFQSEHFVHASKDRPVRRTILDHTLKNLSKAVSERKRTPLTGRNASEQSEYPSLVHGSHSLVVDQHRWPAMKGGKVSTMTFSRSMDLTDRIGKATSFMLQSRGLSPIRRELQSDGVTKNIHKPSNEMAQHTSLEETAKVEHHMNFGVNVASPYVHKGKALPYSNPSMTFSLPIVASCRPSSPNSVSALSSSASKRTPSPFSTRPSSPSFSSNNTSQIGTIYQLQLLYNRELQWRFVNSQAVVALNAQKIAAENVFNNVWNVTSELQDYVTMEKHKIEIFKQEMKLKMLLKEQVSYLEDWISIEEEYSTSLFGTIEALKASTLKLPVTGGAMADVLAVKRAFSSAIDIMQAMGSSVCYLLSKVEGTKRYFCQLSAVVTKEKEKLDECRALLATVAAMKVEECSLRAQILQQLRQDMHM